MNILKRLTPAKGLWLSLVLFAALALVACGGGSSGGSSSSSGNGSGSNGENGDSDTPGFADDPEMVEGPLDPLQELLGEAVFDELIAVLREQGLDGEAEATVCVEQASNILVDGGDAVLLALIEEDPDVASISDAVLSDADLANRVAAAYQRIGNSLLLALGAGGTCDNPGDPDTGVPEVDGAAMGLVEEIDALVLELLALADDPTTAPDAIRDVLAMSDVGSLLAELEMLVEQSGLDVPFFDNLSTIAGALLEATDEFLTITGADEVQNLVENVVDLTLDTTEVLLIELLALDPGEVDDFLSALTELEAGLLDDVLNDIVGLLESGDIEDLDALVADLQDQVEALLEVDGGLTELLNNLLTPILDLVDGLLGGLVGAGPVSDDPNRQAVV